MSSWSYTYGIYSRAHKIITITSHRWVGRRIEGVKRHKGDLSQGKSKYYILIFSGLVPLTPCPNQSSNPVVPTASSTLKLKNAISLHSKSSWGRSPEPSAIHTTFSIKSSNVLLMVIKLVYIFLPHFLDIENSCWARICRCLKNQPIFDLYKP